MIVHINHRQPERAILTGEVLSTLMSLEGAESEWPVNGDVSVHLDWVQYKSNFREPVMIRRAIRADEYLPTTELAIDLRQVQPETVRGQVCQALGRLREGYGSLTHSFLLEDFRAMRSSIIWSFNNLFWRYLPLWERASGKGYERALPT